MPNVRPTGFFLEMDVVAFWWPGWGWHGWAGLIAAAFVVAAIALARTLLPARRCRRKGALGADDGFAE